MHYEALRDLDVNISRIKAVLDHSYPPGWSLAFPCKPNPGLYYTLEGVFSIRINGCEYDVPPGCVIALSDGDDVFMSNRTDENLYMLQFTFWAGAPLRFADLHIPHVTPDADGRWRRLFMQANALFVNRPPAYLLGLRGLLEEVLRGLILNAAEEAVRAAPSRSQRLSQLKAFIAGNYMHPLTLEDLCRHAHYSPSRLRAICESEMGMSPMQYLHQIRMDHACTLLRESDASLQYIADHTGFGSVSYFCRSFRKSTGQTPGEYRSNAENA